MNKPFKLSPSGKDYLWGGNRLKTEFGKEFNLFPLAESWECSTHPDGPSYVASGENKGMSLTDVIKENPMVLGSHNEGLTELPILVKLIDADKDLSVQVHPTDEYAHEYEHGQLGKTEMWYVLDADTDAKLVYGFNRDCNEKLLREAINNDRLTDYLQQVNVKKNDVFYIRSGMVHAIGKGIMIAEIQENSNLTYRLYDYGRLDKNGNLRELHIDKAMKVADMTSAVEPKQPMRVLRYGKGSARELLCHCKYFEVYRMIVNTVSENFDGVSYRADSISYRVLLCIDGNGIIEAEDETISINKGDCIFYPADSVATKISGKLQLLDICG